MQNILLSLVILILPFAIYDIQRQIKELKNTKNRINELTDKIKNMSSEDIKKEQEINDFFNDIRKLQIENVDTISNKTIKEYEKKNLSEVSGVRNIDIFFGLHERKNREVKSIFEGVFYVIILSVLFYIFWFQYELLVSLFKLLVSLFISSLNYSEEILIILGSCFLIVFLFVKNFRTKIVRSIMLDIENIFYSLGFFMTNRTKEDKEREETQGLLYFIFFSLVIVSFLTGINIVYNNMFKFSFLIVGFGLLLWIFNKFNR